MPRWTFYLLFTVSGFAGLIYESIWTHYLKLFLGHAAYAQSLVLVVFMGGMAAGAAWCARFSERLARPLLGYALVEAVIGAAALVFHPVFVAATEWSYGSLLPALGGESAALAAKFSLCCLLIAPQSVLLGMTFPLMSAALVRAHRATPGESLAKGAYAFERVEATRLAWYARNFLVGVRPAPEAVPTQLQKDLELVQVRLLECREPRELDVWLHSALRVARAVNPYLMPDDAGAVWRAIASTKCFSTLPQFQRRWIELFAAVAARDAARMARHARELLDTTPELGTDAREYLVLAALSASVAGGAKPAALELWRAQKTRLRAPAAPAFRLLRCHAEAASCAAEFSLYAER